MVEISVSYTGNLRCTAEHGPSKTQLFTDAPVDNQGRGEAFSPTDLVATALGTCMLTIMGMRARERSHRLEGTKIVVQKHMTTTAPRRIAKLDVQVSVPHGAELSDADRQVLMQAAHTCPVRLSISEAIDVPVRFSWGEAAE
jgi:putative redox protein